ncbi:hypothetical protein [Prosthecomicrobium sp. N25]|uniref:hypothetical protein n=1 Tax=Prosthecomicrobium sp. N25 TaxID=3129254 RepID=UPI0030785813
MSTFDLSIWRSQNVVSVTDDHVDRAIRAHACLMTEAEVKKLPLDSVLMAAEVIAHVESFRIASGDGRLLSMLVANEIGLDLRRWMVEGCGMVDPNDPARKRAEREAAERKQERANRLANARANRANRRADAIEAAVIDRLKAA